MDKDVTKEVDFGDIDSEYLHMRKCVCGREHKDYESISIYREYAEKCEDCGRKLYFRASITVYEVNDED